MCLRVFAIVCLCVCSVRSVRGGRVLCFHAMYQLCKLVQLFVGPDRNGLFILSIPVCQIPAVAFGATLNCEGEGRESGVGERDREKERVS